MLRGGPLRTQVRSCTLTLGVLSKRVQWHSQGWATQDPGALVHQTLASCAARRAAAAEPQLSPSCHLLAALPANPASPPRPTSAVMAMSGAGFAKATATNVNLAFGAECAVDAMAPTPAGFHDVFGNLWQVRCAALCCTALSKPGTLCLAACVSLRVKPRKPPRSLSRPGDQGRLRSNMPLCSQPITCPARSGARTTWPPCPAARACTPTTTTSPRPATTVGGGR